MNCERQTDREKRRRGQKLMRTISVEVDDDDWVCYYYYCDQIYEE